MRHILRIIGVSIFASTAVFNASSATEDVEIDGLIYTIDLTLKTAVVTGTNVAHLEQLIIPSYI